MALPALHQEYSLSGQIETFAAADITAGDHVIYANHVCAGFLKLLAILAIRARGNLGFFGADHPANRERCPPAGNAGRPEASVLFLLFRRRTVFRPCVCAT